MVIAALLAAWAIPLFFGESFFESLSPFVNLLPGYLLFSVNILLAAYFAGINRLRINFIGSTICFLLVLLLDLWLIPLYGMAGAAIASSVAYAAATFYSIFQFISITGKSVKEIFILHKDDWRMVKELFQKRKMQ